MSEFDFIHDLKSLSDPNHALNLEDDAAALPAGDIICTDTLVESVHFLGRETPQDLAHKLLAVNVSDVVAMNARPTHALLNLTLPSYCDPTWRAGFIEGLGQACELFSVQVLGGDTTRSPGPLVLSATLLGMLEGRQMWRRAGARVGDLVCVGGTIGRGALGLDDMMAGKTNSTAALHFKRPMPRLDLLGCDGVSGCADVSDGLVADLAHICRASGVSSTLDLSRIPYADPSADWALQATGGDDYELVFTLSPTASLPAGCTVVGEIVPIQGDGTVALQGPADMIEATLAQSGYEHF